MAAHVFFLLMFLVFSQDASAQSNNTLVAKLNKQGTRIELAIGTPPQAHLFVLDFDTNLSILPCNGQRFVPSESTTYATGPCSAKSCRGTCSADNQCLFPISQKTSVPVFMDVVTLNNSEGKTSSPQLSLGCLKTNLGIAAMSRSRFAIPKVIGPMAKIPPKFTICRSRYLPSKLFFGEDKSFVAGGVKVSDYGQFIPFVTNPQHPDGYYLGLQTINVDSASLGLSSSLFTEGLKISSKDRYTKLTTPAYTAVVEAFKKYAYTYNISVVPAIAPFGVCFNANNLNFNQLGPVVPTVDLVFQNGTTWSLAGDNLIESFNDNKVGCLAIEDAGNTSVSSLGLFQQFDNLLRFDVGGSKFGFIDRSLRVLRLSCRSVGVSSSS